MNNRAVKIHRQKLLNYRTKNEMAPTFLSGIFLSGAINILTTDTSRSHLIEMISMLMMFISSTLFFVEASKIHELQFWYNSLNDVEKQDEDYFLNSAIGWNLGKWKGAYKKIIISLPTLAWITGLLSLPIYFLSSDIEQVMVQIGCICQLR